jgi:hypothetical protein
MAPFFVRTVFGDYLLRVEDFSRPEGFVLLDSNGRPWDGAAAWDSWTVVSDDEVPAQIRSKLESVRKQFESA